MHVALAEISRRQFPRPHSLKDLWIWNSNDLLNIPSQLYHRLQYQFSSKIVKLTSMEHFLTPSSLTFTCFALRTMKSPDSAGGRRFVILDIRRASFPMSNFPIFVKRQHLSMCETKWQGMKLQNRAIIPRNYSLNEVKQK